MRIYLVGFMGAGKTWAGKQLAQALRLDFYDLDSLVEQAEGMAVRQIFEQKGEGAFRESEARCLRQTAQFDRAVIATGGGTPCFWGNMDWINGNGLSVYLKKSTAALFEVLALERGHRPLISSLSDGELWAYIEKKVAERAFFYEQAHLFCEAADDKMSHLNEAIAFLGKFLPAKEK
jgi:shikimate kinase